MSELDSIQNQRQMISQLVADHTAWRRTTINLIASENALSPSVHAALQGDLVQRYGDYGGRDLSARKYMGNRFIEQIEREAVRIAQETFGARYVELRPISGHVAGAAVLMGLCQPGDLVLEPGREAGGHREGGKLVTRSSVPIKVDYLPFDAGRYNIDIDRAGEMIAERKPRAVILGSSNFLFPHPVTEVADLIRQNSPHTILIYDASHVMGFLAARRFQDPLREGAEIVFGSTHKTLPGPQGGIIFSNRDDLMEAACGVTYPALVTNHHLFRIPALAMALLEMQAWGGEYADQITANSQALGAALEKQGVPCVCVDGVYSRSHTLLACVNSFGSAGLVASRLEQAGIIATAAHLPEVWGVEGIRLGVQEVTRLGAVEKDMPQIAHWIAQAVQPGANSAMILRQTADFAGNLGPVRFTWED